MLRKKYVPLQRMTISLGSGAHTFVAFQSKALNVLVGAVDDNIAATNLTDGSLRWKLAGDETEITAITVTKDGKLLIFATFTHLCYVYRVEDIEKSYAELVEKQQQDPEDTFDEDCVKVEPVKSFKVSSTAYAVCMDCDYSHSLVAIGCTDSFLRVFDISGYCTHTFRGFTGVVSHCMFGKAIKAKKKSHLSKIEHQQEYALTVYASANEGDLKACSLIQKKSFPLSSHTSAILSMCVSDCGTLLATSAGDNILSLWDITEKSLIATIPIFEAIEGMDFARINKKIYAVCGTENGNLFIINKKGKKYVDLKFPQTRFVSIRCCGMNVWSTDASQRLRLFKLDRIDFETIEKNYSKDAIVKELKMDSLFILNRGDVTDFAYDDRSNSLIVVTNSEHVEVLSLNNRSSSLLVGHTDVVLCCALNCDGTTLATAGKDTTIRLWNHTDLNCREVLTGHTETVTAICCGSKSPNLLLSVSKDTTLKIWDSKEGKSYVKATLAAHTKEINSVAIAPNDSLACTGSQDRTIQLYDLKKCESIGVLKGHRRGVWCVLFSPTDRVVFSTSADNTMRVWALNDHSCLRVFEGHSAAILRAVCISKGTQILSADSAGSVKLWDIKSGECVNTFAVQSEKLWAILSISDGEHFVVGGGPTMSVWKDNTKEEALRLQTEADNRVLLTQQLSNHLHRKRFWKALQIALDLNHSRDVLRILELVYDANPTTETETDTTTETPQTISGIVNRLTDQHSAQLFGYCVDWAATSRHATVAHVVINAFLRAYDYEALKEKIPKLGEHVAHLLPHTTRQHRSAFRRSTQAKILDYTVAQMEHSLRVLELGDESEENEESDENDENGANESDESDLSE